MEKRTKKTNVKWTKEECYRAASECGSRSEFKEKCGSGYVAALKNKWLGDYWWFKRKQNPFADNMDNVYGYFFTDFNSVYVGRTINPQERDSNHRIRGTVYNFARKNKTEVPEMVLLETNLSLENGLELEDYYVDKFKKEGWKVLNKAKTGKGCGSLGGLGSGKWTKEECYRAACEYKTRNEFRKNCGGGYTAAYRNNWLDEFLPKSRIEWTKEECYKAAREYGSRSEFQKNCGGGYNAAYRNNWLDELFPKSRIEWTKEECYKAACEYNTREEFKKNCSTGYYAAYRNNWLDEFLPKSRIEWTKEECYKAARDYNTCSNFQKNCGSGYNAAYRNNWLGDYWWFDEIKKPNGYWTKERCYEVAREFNNRNKFRKNCSGGYEAAYRNKWLDELFPKNKKSA